MQRPGELVPWTGRISIGVAMPLLVSVALLLGGASMFWARAHGPGDGTLVSLSDRVIGPTLFIRDVLEPTSPLKGGDTVLAIAGIAVGADEGRPPASAGDVLTYTVLRDGRVNVFPVKLSDRSNLGRWAGDNWSAVLLVALFLGVAIQVFLRRPRDPAAGTLLVTAVAGSVGVCAYLLGGQVVDLAYGRDTWAFVGGELCLCLLWVGWLLFILVLPRRAFSWTFARLGWLSVGLAVALVAACLGVVLPDAPSARVEQWRLIAVSLGPGYVMPALIVGVALARFLRARGSVEGRYLGWLLLAFAASALSYAFFWAVPAAFTGTPLIDLSLQPIAFLPCVITFTAAVLRFGLFDIKTVARRSLLFGALTVTVLLGYVGMVAAIGSLFTPDPLSLPAVFATVVVAMLAAPLKDRLRLGISRLLYGMRDEPYVTLNRLGAQLERSASPDSVLDLVATTVATTLKLPLVAVELVAPDGSVVRRAEHRVDELTEPAGAVLPAVVAGMTVGRIVAVPRRPETEFAPRELALLTDLARQSAPALRALQLTIDLRDSRRRLVLARAEERRRLQRDLHDGLGPSLAGIRMQLGAARARLRDGRVAHLEDDLQDLEGQVVTCTDDVRALLVGLRLPLLDSLGLVGALHHQADRIAVVGRLAINVETGDVPDLPAATEAAALAIASEAMTNVARHSGASCCVVALAVDEQLRLSITDDGCGIAVASRARPEHAEGIGMRSMRERAEGIGGSFEFAALRSGGTRVTASLPLLGDPP